MMLFVGHSMPITHQWDYFLKIIMHFGTSNGMIGGNKTGHPGSPPPHSHEMSQKLIVRVVYILATLILDDHVKSNRVAHSSVQHMRAGATNKQRAMAFRPTCWTSYAARAHPERQYTQKPLIFQRGAYIARPLKMLLVTLVLSTT